MSLGWIDPGDFSFNCLLLADAWIVRYISLIEDAGFRRNLALALAANPAVLWYFSNSCPDCRDRLEALAVSAPASSSPEEVRLSEEFVLGELDTFVVYLYPELMEELPYISAWRAERLLSMAEFSGRRVLDIGSGTGRLAVAASASAAWVVASEPVARLREYLRAKLDRLEIRNVYVTDGMVERLPFPDDSFDIVMSGHVMGEDYIGEFNEMFRVTRPGGYILDCPGEESKKNPDGAEKEMLDLGFECLPYVSELGGDVFRYRFRKTR